MRHGVVKAKVFGSKFINRVRRVFGQFFSPRLINFHCWISSRRMRRNVTTHRPRNLARTIDERSLELSATAPRRRSLRWERPAVDAIKVIKRDQDTGAGGRIDDSGGCSKVSRRGGFRRDACGSSRIVSLHFAAVNACHSEGRCRMSRERALTKAAHEDENRRRPFLGPATPFRWMIPLCEDHRAPFGFERREMKRGRR